MALGARVSKFGRRASGLRGNSIWSARDTCIAYRAASRLEGRRERMLTLGRVRTGHSAPREIIYVRACTADSLLVPLGLDQDQISLGILACAARHSGRYCTRGPFEFWVGVGP